MNAFDGRSQREQGIRPYLVTNGRTHPSAPLDLLSMVRSTGQVPHDVLGPEHSQTLRLCRSPTTVAEVAGHLRQPAVVVKILLSDLIGTGAVTTHDPTATADVTPDLIEKVLHGLRSRL
ncbi:Protein of unknown function [Actinopolyspora xinjiangensis]|uniref:DUF742 domain-containing protein n=1 Tax=Actinopolyspora xinjiangensis TaxID=405564 RepID=A0A1H0WYS2_9ACTN|nr:DUF742 domain-containing protein [Actinopolyspora xinjiangensis]SDP95770.1 Protein of unknown function [Actinopolyspora xinjiangensis]